MSVLVISYNSSKFILQTLESIKNQTYGNLELVISDDCSTDDTLTIADHWIKENSTRFAKTHIIRNPSNKGIPGNLNSGLEFCTGLYVKPIAADDILDVECIEKNYHTCEAFEYKALFSKATAFSDNDVENADDTYFDWSGKTTKFFDYPPDRQAKVLLYNNFLVAPTFFVRRDLLLDLNGYDEHYKYMEDYPMWLKMTEAGVKLNFYPCITVYYRCHDGSVSNASESLRVFHPGFYLSSRQFFYSVRLQRLIENKYFYRAYQGLLHYFYGDLVMALGNTRNVFTLACKALYFLDPVRVFSRLRKEYLKKC